MFAIPPAGPACGWGSAKFPAREGEARLLQNESCLSLMYRARLILTRCLRKFNMEFVKVLQRELSSAKMADPEKELTVDAYQPPFPFDFPSQFVAGKVSRSPHSVFSLCI